MWITACELWSEGALKWEKKSFSIEFEVTTNKHTHRRASYDASTGMPFIPSVIYFITVTQTHIFPNIIITAFPVQTHQP